MKGITKVALSIALVAILALSVVVASVAWFTSNPSVDANDVTLDAARTLTVVFDSENALSDYSYSGQTGNGPDLFMDPEYPEDPDYAQENPNAPYVYEAGNFTLNLRTSASTKRGRVKVEFGTVEIKREKGEGGYTISNVLITDLFAFTANCYVKDEESGEFIKENGVFKLDPNNAVGGSDHYSLTGYTISDDGYLMNADGLSEARFADGIYCFSFTFTFLPTAAYAYWLSKDYEKIAGYRLNPGGEYAGVVSYTEYLAKYHYGLPRYERSGDSAPYTFTESETGNYVKVITSYSPYEGLQKFERSGDVYTESATGSYLKIADTDEYEQFWRYVEVNGFPYSHPEFQSAKYTFRVACSVEEV